ncbi:UbiX family flavin prenyltransferase [Candidatus Palibaumannia cicadellinicola]|uniref:Flavin prenyltransferase UbiX n=1 Tax=Candidatus Palibaumannia cicadellinicola TaxID=186490 RepID=A0A0K2BKQ0_9GAMM|nr:UbiX family flavin prenyltransferase [Candidatus Baumannia cicadellinicola]AKZ65910.1 3-polyprenyl-4-hydroxybenzoate carboxy-lyase [Candidatus Baumannia cicadellinicola]
MKKRLIVGITGASGAIYGIRLLQVLKNLPNNNDNFEIHLILSRVAYQTIELETDFTICEVNALADVVHDVRNLAASISSGSFKTTGMIILPCSIKTLSSIVNSYSTDLLIRAADVVLKERRRLVLCIRETPLHIGHLRMMTKATELGAIIMPPVPAFYHRPSKISDIIDQTVNRTLDQLEINLYQSKYLVKPWQGIN